MGCSEKFTASRCNARLTARFVQLLDIMLGLYAQGQLLDTMLGPLRGSTSRCNARLIEAISNFRELSQVKD